MKIRENLKLNYSIHKNTQNQVLLFVSFFNFQNIHIFLLDNDEPTISTSDHFPVEHKDSVVLTCHSNTNDVGIWYFWEKNERSIGNSSTKTFALAGNKRTNSGSYKCLVMTINVVIMSSSDTLNVTFYCKFKISSTSRNIGTLCLSGVVKLALRQHRVKICGLRQRG